MLRIKFLLHVRYVSGVGRSIVRWFLQRVVLDPPRTPIHPSYPQIFICVLWRCGATTNTYKLPRYRSSRFCGNLSYRGKVEEFKVSVIILGFSVIYARKSTKEMYIAVGKYLFYIRQKANIYIWSIWFCSKFHFINNTYIVPSQFQT